MSIRIVRGDVTTATEQIIVHQVNCQGKMGSGVAKAIKEKFPIVYNKYIESCNINSPKSLLGKIQIIPISTNKTIINMFSQLYYGYNNDSQRYTSYVSFFNCFIQVIEYASYKGITSIALPYKIGCDRGGADWDKVIYPFLWAVAQDIEIDIVLYQL